MNNPVQPALAFLTALGFFGCIFYMLHWGFPAENKDALNSLMGVLTTIFTLQQNYFFGSTSGSKAKDDVIGSIAQASPSPVNIPNADTVTVKTETGNVTIPK